MSRITMAILLIASFCTRATAANYSWNDPFGGIFQEMTNWTPLSPVGGPGASDRVIFTIAVSNPIVFSSSTTTTGFTVAGTSTVILDIGVGNTYTVSGTNDFTVGNANGQSASLTIASGTLQLTALNAGSPSGGIGTSTGSSGLVTVSGTGTLTAIQLLAIGINGSGSLVVQNGGSVTLTGGAALGTGSTGTGLIRVTGTGSSLTASAITSLGSGSLIVENGGTAAIATLRTGTSSSSNTVTVGSGGTLNSSFETALGMGGTGTTTATVSGTWNQTDSSIYIGGTSTGSGATASVAINNGGVLNVTGPGNGITTYAGRGTLTINTGVVNTGNFTNGGTLVFNDGTLRIIGGFFFPGSTTFSINGATSTSQPTLVMSGLGAQFTNGPSVSLTVGDSRTGQFQVNDGAFMTIQSITLGNGAGSSGTLSITGSGTQISTSGPAITVGKNGSGVVSVQSSGGLETRGGELGFFPNSIGTATISGTGSRWNTLGFPLFVGRGGTGTVTATANGSITTSTLSLGVSSGGAGTLNVNSGGLVDLNGNTLVIGGSLDGPGGNGTVNIDGGGTVLAGGVRLYPSGHLGLSGGTLTLAALFPLGGSIAFNGGTVGFTSNWTTTADEVSALLGTGYILGPGRSINVTSNLTLQAPIVLDGGTITTGKLVEGKLFQFNRGTLGINSDGLVIGGSGPLGRTVTLGPGMILDLKSFDELDGLLVDTDGLLVLNGGTANGNPKTLGNDGGIINLGEIQLASSVSLLGGPGLRNEGRLSGTGRIGGRLQNNAGGVISVDVGQRLVFGANVANFNNTGGLIELTGGTLEFANQLTNNAGASIRGRGIIRTSTSNPSATGLSNLGTMQFSGGFTDIFGIVLNSGTIINSGGATVTFYDAVTHNGPEIRTSIGSRTVFFGPVTGAGPFTQSGTVQFENTYSPGNSPAQITLNGDLVLGDSATLKVELGGTTPGSQFDQILVSGNAGLSGKLDVALIDGFIPVTGERFDILVSSSRTGDFQAFSGLELDNGLRLQPEMTSTTYSLVVTPVPEVNTILFLGSVVLLHWCRKNCRSSATSLAV